MIQLGSQQVGKKLYFSLSRGSSCIPRGCLNDIAEKILSSLSFFTFLLCRRGRETKKREEGRRAENEIEIEWLQREAIKNMQAMATGTEPPFTSGHFLLWPTLRWMTARIFREYFDFVKGKKTWGHFPVNVPSRINEKK